MKKKIVLSLYSLSFFVVWGVCFLSLSSDNIAMFLGLIYSLVGTYFIQEKYELNLNVYDKMLVLFGPFIYLCLFIIFQGNLSVLFFFNPLIIGTLIVILNLTLIRDLSKGINLFFFIFFIILYVHTFYPEWSQTNLVAETDNFDLKQNEKEQKGINDAIKLSDYSFIDNNLDTIRIIGESKYVLLETWNETCPPCIKAFKELPSFYRSHNDKMDVYYVYEHNKASVRKMFNKIFTYKHIQDPSKILVDIDQEFYLNSGMKGYPYFLLFNEKGDLIFHYIGYFSEDRLALEQAIVEKIR